MSNNPKIWAIIPAAGVGARMASVLPKQYLELHNKPIIQHAIERVFSCSAVCAAVVALSEHDSYWDNYSFAWDKPVYRVVGGRERSDSVYQALLSIAKIAAPNDWVLVHDAARPCVSIDDIDNLVTTALSRQQAAILGYPCKDSMKRACISEEEVAQISAVVERDRLWHALTPQLFPLRYLLESYARAIEENLSATDDAMVYELSGRAVMLVQGSELNLKITRSDDLVLADFILQHQLK